ncbi:hypothetical protein EKI60_05915 [Candidatus Saccharibacteria bacterium]|nr:MAG: hypothetical protein EKI60_05915 [Candidatus Saccharibacteria bacterium]
MTDNNQVNGSFDRYQSLIDETAIYPAAGTGSWIALAYVALGLGEAGELQGKLKKMMRDDDFILTDEKRNAILAELGDILWYVGRMAEELDVDLSDVAQANVDKLLDRKSRDVLKGSGDYR